MRATIAATACAVAFGAAPALAAPGDDLPPDLVTLRPTDLSITKSSRHLQLRLSNTIANQGAGALELYPDAPGFGDCDADEQPAFQRVFEDFDGNGYFDRGIDPQAGAPDPVGCMAFHPSHGHWHFQDFARYELRHETSGKLAARSTDAVGKKVSFCVIDTFIAIDEPPLPGTPGLGFYGGEGCSCPDAGCGPDELQGLSIGYADIYTAGLPGQKINIDGLPKGKYCLISTADPVDRLAEASELNNDRRRRLLLHPRKRELDRLKGPCRGV